ncbi:MAG: glutaredoxin family protein [Pirellulales bacterium]|nr:glutaredoxin family protein [Pirellulales bacterium]
MEINVYTRSSCPLCDEAKDILNQHGLRYRERDIALDARLTTQFDTCVPVVEIDGKVRFRGKVDPILLQRLVDHAKRGG